MDTQFLTHCPPFCVQNPTFFPIIEKRIREETANGNMGHFYAIWDQKKKGPRKGSGVRRVIILYHLLQLLPYTLSDLSVLREAVCLFLPAPVFFAGSSGSRQTNKN